MISKKDVLYSFDNGNLITLPKAFGYVDYYVDGHNTRIYDYWYSKYMTAVDTADNTVFDLLKNILSNPSTPYLDSYEGNNNYYSFELGNVGYITTEHDGVKVYQKITTKEVILWPISEQGINTFLTDWKNYIGQTNDVISCLDSEDRLCYLDRVDGLAPFRITLDFDNLGAIVQEGNYFYLKDRTYNTIFNSNKMENIDDVFEILASKIKNKSTIYVNHDNNSKVVFNLNSIVAIYEDSVQTEIMTDRNSLYLDSKFLDMIREEWTNFLAKTGKDKYLSLINEKYYINFLKVSYVYKTNDTQLTIVLGNHSIITDIWDFNELIPSQYNSGNVAINLRTLLTIIKSDGSCWFRHYRTDIPQLSSEQLDDLLISWLEYLHLSESNIIEIN